MLDFVKLGIYVSFFVILLMFYGLPIHIMRDLFMTARSFTKRLATFVKYRKATQDMNARYEDATVEDIQREDTCIICREDMRPWSVTNPEVPPAAPGAAPPARAPVVNERTRPKRLPCGHILHLGCLKSWLERQQVCPTCRRPVLDTASGQPTRGPTNNANQAAQNGQPPAPGQQDGGVAPAPPRGGARRGMRMLNLGPLRVGFGQANLQDFAQGLAGPQAGQENGGAGGARIYGLELGFPRRAQPQIPIAANMDPSAPVQDQLQQLEQQIMTEIRSLQVTQQELHLVQLLQVELARLRLLQNGAVDPLAVNPQMPLMPQLGAGTLRPLNPNPPQMARHGARPNTAPIPSGSSDLPPGVTIPEGWSLLPLERLDGPMINMPQTTGMPIPGFTVNTSLAPTATTQSGISPMASSTSNNTLTSTANLMPDAHSQASLVDSSDTNAIYTPPSVAADQSAVAGPSNISTPQTSRNIASSSSSTTTPTATQEDSADVLPNWGSSQLFTGRSPLANEVNPSDSSEVTPPIHRGRGSSAAEGSAPPETFGTDEESHSAEKGKAKAATVEDTVDEAKGS